MKLGYNAQNIVTDFNLIALDIGARDGFCDDLKLIGDVVSGIGFEPDKEECERLNEYSHPVYNSVRYLPEAVGKEAKNRTLKIYSKAGCSSFLEAKRFVGEKFSRADYYNLVNEFNVDTVPLDILTEKYSFADARFLKLDVQGMELEILETAQELLNDSMVALRIEVNFLQHYEEQPLFWEISKYVRNFKFIPMLFLEKHRWRTNTQKKFPFIAEGGIPFSRGQLIHGDMLFMIDRINYEPDFSLERNLSDFYISLCYGFIDRAKLIADLESVRAYFRKFDINIEKELRQFSYQYGKLKSRQSLNKFRLLLKKHIQAFYERCKR